LLLAAVAFSCEREVTTPASPTTTSVKISDETMLVKDGLVYISSFSSGAILEDEFKARNTRKQSVAAIDAVKSFISADEAYLAISPDDYSTTEAALGINTPCLRGRKRR
jgi:hypothetical protein